MSTSDSVPRQGQGGQTEDWPAHGDGGGTPLSVRHEQAGSAMLLTLAGELDVTVTDSVRAAVGRCLREQPERLLVDLRALAFCDCAGARTLRWAQDQAAAAGTRFQLTGAGPMVIRILTLTRAATLLAAARADDHAHDGAEAVRPGAGRGPQPVSTPGH